MKPINELSDFELLDLFEIVCYYSKYDPHGYYDDHYNFYGLIGKELKEILKSRLLRLQSLENDSYI